MYKVKSFFDINTSFLLVWVKIFDLLNQLITDSLEVSQTNFFLPTLGQKGSHEIDKDNKEKHEHC